MANGSLIKGEIIAECSPLEHSAILLTCFKRLSVLKTNFSHLFEWPLKTGFTVHTYIPNKVQELEGPQMKYENIQLSPYRLPGTINSGYLVRVF